MKNLVQWFAAIIALIATMLPASAAEYFVYFGTYTGPKSKGVYVSRFDSATGKLTDPELAGEVAQPSWVTLHPSGRFLYAVSELGNDSIITSFSIDKATGKLTQLNKVSTGGRMGCHLAIDKPARSIFIAHYGDGSTAAHQLLPDGTVGEQTALLKHDGSGADQRRQRGPHAHAVVLSKDDKHLVVPDLGTDKYMVYRVASGGKLAAAQPAFAQVKGGLGPRHFAFHPGGKFAYGLNEMGSSATVFSFANGELKEMQTISTLPADFREVNNTAEIEVDEAGRFVYASNRGHDSIAVFAVDLAKGTLSEVQREPTGGKTPRNFKVDPTGQFLLAANQNSDNVVVFRRDPKSGRLTPTGQTVTVGSPVCIQFLRK
jgi:6-phosphogluconolactonase